MSTTGKGPFLIGVDGHGGSGKSTLAAWLGQQLDAEILHTDDFASWDNPLDWWQDLRRIALEPLRAGATSLSYARSSWASGHHPEPVVDQPVTKTMILEGVSSLRREFRAFVDYGIFVETPAVLCLERGLERDRGSDGRSDDAVRATWEEWMRAETAHSAEHRPREFADVIVDGTRPWSDQLDVNQLSALRFG